MIEDGSQIGAKEQEKVGPDELLLVGEPILRRPEGGKRPESILVPKGLEGWGLAILRADVSDAREIMMLGEEYLSIAQTLKSHNIPFRFIVSHENLVDPRLVLGMTQILGMKGSRFFPQIPPYLTCFPQDLLIKLEGKTIVNPAAGLEPQKDMIELSLLGEGGGMLRVGRKMLIADPLAYKEPKRKAHIKAAKSLACDFQIGSLPWPIGVEISPDGKIEQFPTTHLDRAAALIKGKDEKDYLLLEPSYANESVKFWGRYQQVINETCSRMGIEVIVAKRETEDVPYSINLFQFRDKSILLSQGHKSLEDLLKELVGAEEVLTTSRPIVFYPILRRGGIRCMLLTAPKAMFKPLKQETSSIT